MIIENRPGTSSIEGIGENALPFLYTQSGLVDSDDRLYTSLGRSYTDLDKFTQDRHHGVCLFLATTNPFASRFVSLMESFVAGEGPVPMAADPNVKTLIDDFWFNEWNKMQDRSISLTRELAIFGEQLMRLTSFGEADTTSEDGAKMAAEVPDIFVDGLLGIQTIDPIRIYDVVPSKFDNQNVVAVRLKRKSLDGGKSDTDPALRIPIAKEKLDSEGKRRLVDGNGLWLKINSAVTSTRGLSDLYPLADYLGLYSQIQFNMAEQANQRSFWFYDVMLEGATDQAIRDFRIQLLKHPPQPGSVQVHNEKATLEPKNVQLSGGSEIGDINNAMFSTIITGLGWPSHWTGLTSSGRSVAEAAHDPALKLFTTRQAKIRNILMKVLRIQVDYAAMKGRFGGVSNLNEQYKLIFPKLAMRDFQRSGGVVARLAQALRDSVDQDLIDPKVARMILAKGFELAGVLDGDVSTMDIVNAEPNNADRAPEPTTTESIRMSRMLAPIEEAIDDVLGSRNYPDEAVQEQIRRQWHDLMVYHLID